MYGAHAVREGALSSDEGADVRLRSLGLVARLLPQCHKRHRAIPGSPAERLGSVAQKKGAYIGATSWLLFQPAESHRVGEEPPTEAIISRLTSRQIQLEVADQDEGSWPLRTSRVHAGRPAATRRCPIRRSDGSPSPASFVGPDSRRHGSPGPTASGAATAEQAPRSAV